MRLSMGPIMRHWPVPRRWPSLTDLGAPPVVTCSTAGAPFAELKAHPGIGRAEAFRISVRELIKNGTDFEAHPSQWAPFEVVGEGGVPTSTLPKLVSEPILIRRGTTPTGK